jgi:hypothetical protein
MHNQRVCCCDGVEPAQCCADYPVYCFDGDTCEGGCWYAQYRTGVFVNSQIEWTNGVTSLTLSYVGSTQAIDPATNDAFCGFPDPQQYPYPAPAPGLPPTPVFPNNYSVPIFAVNDPTNGYCELVYPIFNKDLSLCWAAVLGFEVRGATLIQKLLATWGTSPNNLTGCADGTGQHWYLTGAGTLRYFADMGRWKSRGTGYGPAYQKPFHIQDIVECSNADVGTFECIDWCKENGRCAPECRCNHSWPEDPTCCRDLICEFDLQLKLPCGEQTINCEATFRTDWLPPTCDPVAPIPRLNGGSHFPLSDPNLPGGSWSLTEVVTGDGQCCPVDAGASTFTPPDVAAIKVGCNLVLADIFDPCDPITTQTWDMVAAITMGATVFSAECPGTFLVSSTIYLGVRFRSCGDGCCLEDMDADEIYWLDFLTVPGQCQWRTASGSITFRKRPGLC